MSTTFGDRLRERRKSAGLSQEQLAENCGVSVQAVSKWETNLCYPEVRQLMGIADLFHTSVDFLLGRESAKDGWDELPDDGVLRVLQYRGRTLLRCDNCTPKEYIPLAADAAEGFTLQIEIWGCADINGDITGTIRAGNAVNCKNIGGNLSNVNCGNVGSKLSANGDVNCGNIGGNLDTSGDVNCGNIEGDLDAGGDVTCLNIRGDVNCAGDLHCKTITGEAHCERDIYYER